MSSESLPVGAILPFAADDTSNVLGGGWRLCNGDSLPKNKYPELFAAIQYTNGGQESLFSLPDLRGRFLRGASSSLQPGTVSPAKTYNPFKAALSNVPDDYFHTVMGAIIWEVDMVDWNPGSNLFQVVGGDKETRPANIYMNFIIKVKGKSGVPAGTLAPYAGADDSKALPDQKWLLCNGDAYFPNNYPTLYGTIRKRFTIPGRSDEKFCVPKFDGLFIRGSDNGSERDPDYKARNQAPDGTTGPVVGSQQKYSTAAVGWTLKIDHFPPNATHGINIALGHDNLRNQNFSSNCDVFNSSGARETRPDNVSVQYYCRGKEDEYSGAFPVGGLIAIPGYLVPNPAFWLPADGRSLLTKDYLDLFGVLLNAWGGDANHFNLPDLRGQFLRATTSRAAGAAGQSADPDYASRTSSAPGGISVGTGSKQSFATGNPQNPLVIDKIRYPTDVNANAAISIGHVTSNFTSSRREFAIDGGDTETSPVNVAVNFFIKYKTAGGNAA